jgi:hypothetical protein
MNIILPQSDLKRSTLPTVDQAFHPNPYSSVSEAFRNGLNEQFWPWGLVFTRATNGTSAKTGSWDCSPQSSEELDFAQLEAQLLDLSIRQHPYELDLFICDLAMVTN